MYKEYKQLNLPQIDAEILAFWDENDIFKKSVEQRDADNSFVFYEGPPSANGMPGIHHVMARAMKDIFCRYQTLKGKRVERKGGWDTHGLPIELQVEKELGIRKEDIGTKVSVDDYNKACKATVMRFKDRWDDMTRRMGHWLDLDNPYITFENDYMESCWHLLKKMYDKGLLYKGYTIQPYSPAAGTGLSSHELNMPGAYQEVTDTSAVAMFRIIPPNPQRGNDENLPLWGNEGEDIRILAWTTTPWTLPSNTALTVGPNITYVKIKCKSPYLEDKQVSVILAESLVSKWFGGKNQPQIIESQVIGKGSDLAGIRYEQLLPYGNEIEPIVGSDGADCFKVICGDFVTTEDGTGIVHTAPSFGADDMKVGRANGIGTLTLVDKRGRFLDSVGEFSGEYVKGDYLNDAERDAEIERMKNLSGDDEYSVLIKSITTRSNTYLDVNERIILKLQLENKLFKKEKYVHNYPHCWRTDKPILYYPLDSWFIRASSMKERMSELNKTINWKPAATGEGRFGKWLENLNDWNLSRSRYWGTPLPIWRVPLTPKGGITNNTPQEEVSGISSKGGNAVSPPFGGQGGEICIGSIAQFTAEIEKANKILGLNQTVPNDLHRPYIDEIVLVSDDGQPMYRELDLIDVWFDSGAMPFAQFSHPNPPKERELHSGASSLWEDRGGKKRFLYHTGSQEKAIKLLELAKQRRSNPTDAEKVLWVQLSGKKLDNFKFRREHPVDDFIVDFVCLTKLLIIEVDGGYHNEPDVKEADALRTKTLQDNGFKVIRFTNNQIIGDIDNVLAKIHKELSHRATFTREELRDGMHLLPPFGGQGGFPADYISEGVDQTRGWFYTLHAISAMCYDSVAFKNVVSTGLVLDKNGQKMSKRLGNAVDPFETLDKHGADVTRWYMVSNSQPWDNLKFDIEGLTEVRNKFFGTLYNTYNFFAMYANVDGFSYKENNIPLENRPEIDRWILSKLNSLIQEVNAQYADYEPTNAARLLEKFVDAELSNWYVRQSRRRFWKSSPNPSEGGELSDSSPLGRLGGDKLSAYQTLYTCMEAVSKMMSPIAPFFGDWLYRNLNQITKQENHESVHLASFPKVSHDTINPELEERMDYAQRISSLILSLRKSQSLRVRQPLSKVMLPVLNDGFVAQIEGVKDLILAETNIKMIEFITDTSNIVKKRAKANFKAKDEAGQTLGARLGKDMKTVAAAIEELDNEEIITIEKSNSYSIEVAEKTYTLAASDFDIISEDIPGWLVANDGALIVALDITLSDALIAEGIARELVNRIQNLRKDKNFDITDKIKVTIEQHDFIAAAAADFKDYICSEVLAVSLDLSATVDGDLVEMTDELSLKMKVEKI